VYLIYLNNIMISIFI